MQTKIVGQRIRHLRMQSSMTQKRLAEVLYVSESTISGWERDRAKHLFYHKIINIVSCIFELSTDQKQRINSLTLFRELFFCLDIL
ncbi:MAG: helix-turn-helix domain-containing protein [Oscillospiraceae bacterium]|nr:helix-turn-helix domain-containing protein [Oscillospiraceae bacterium]